MPQRHFKKYLLEKVKAIFNDSQLHKQPKTADDTDLSSRIHGLLGTPETSLSARRRAVERDLINAESALGRSIFGRPATGQQREFFLLTNNVWIWYEDGITVRYEVRKDGVFKKVNQGGYQPVSGAELENFSRAVRLYAKLTRHKIYGQRLQQ